MSIDLDEDFREAYRGGRLDPGDDYTFIRTCNSFKVNKYIQIRLDEFEYNDYIDEIDVDGYDAHTSHVFFMNVYIAGKIACKVTSPLIQFDPDILTSQLAVDYNPLILDDYQGSDQIDNACELQRYLQHANTGFSSRLDSIPLEDSFFAGCSNIQAWAENGYNMSLIYHEHGFTILEHLIRAGDDRALAAFRPGVLHKLFHGNHHVQESVFKNKKKWLSPEDIEQLIDHLIEHDITSPILDRNILERKILSGGLALDVVKRIRNAHPYITIHKQRIYLKGHQKFIVEITKSSGYPVVSLKEIEGLGDLDGIFIKSIYINDQPMNILDLDTLPFSIHTVDYLGASNNKIHTIKGIDRLPNLNYLTLDSNRLTNIQGITPAQNLRELSLRWNQITGLTGIGLLQHLKRLDLESNPLTTIDALGELKELEFLDVSITNITPDAIDVLAKMPALKRVILPRLPLPPEAIDWLREQRPDMEVQQPYSQ